MKVTVKDVAKKAGVSVATVSYVINDGPRPVTDETRNKVLQAIGELDYQPNALARGLVSGKTASIAVIIPQITDPFFPEFVQGVESIASKERYSVFLCNTENSAEKEMEYIATLAGKQVDGIILCGTRLGQEQLSQVSKIHKVAMVTSRVPRGSAAVSTPGEIGLYETTSHLIGLGHQTIGHLGFNLPDDSTRSDGYRRALRENGIGVDENRVVIVSKAGIETGRRAAKQLLDQAPDITAISCYNDLLAIGVLQACKELGIRVPQDMAVVGFDDIRLASLVTPALTTMHVARHKLGEIVMELLLRVINADGVYEEHLKIEAKLIIRESCGSQKKLN